MTTIIMILAIIVISISTGAHMRTPAQKEEFSRHTDGGTIKTHTKPSLLAMETVSGSIDNSESNRLISLVLYLRSLTAVQLEPIVRSL